ncbi:MAG: hypothetical protein NVSMB17_11160 [Candidatus Dormibacteria bacterium]
MGSQVPSRLAFWNRRIGTLSVRNPRLEVVVYAVLLSVVVMPTLLNNYRIWPVGRQG